jgi:hypothetical protein
MHTWMMGIGFIVILMAPCFIAMGMKVENSDED